MTSYDHDMNFGLYLAVLKKSDASPLLPESDEDRGVGTGRRSPPPGACAGERRREDPDSADEPPATPTPRGPRAPVTVQIDFDGLPQRIVSVPGVRERQYSELRAGPDGTVFYLEASRAHLDRGGRAMNCGAIACAIAEWRPSPTASPLTKSAPTGASFLSHRGPRGGGPPAPGTPPPTPSLFIVDTDRNPPQAGQGRLNVALRMYLDPKEEFKQIFNEGWRNQRDYLYVPNMHGTDWPRMKQMYGQLLPYVKHRADLNYLLDMMGAEIAIGHSYVRGGDMPDVPQFAGGLLGADFAIENGRYKMTRIYDNESWNPDLRAPLAAPGANVAVGDYILAINGIELKAPDNIYRLLDGTANRQTSLTVNNTPALTGARNVTVMPVASEQGLRTRAWVESNRRLVEKLSDGQLAYVYLPNTGQPGYTSFNRYYFSQQDKKGVVIDERYNGGGSAADYIIDVLGPRFRWLLQ